MPTRADQSPAAYDDVKIVMDIAINKSGLQYVCKSYGAAINFKQRCNKYRNLLRDINEEQIRHIPGARAEVAYDILSIRQVNAAGEPDRKGAIVVFDHREPIGKLIDPETGEEIDPFNTIMEK